MQVLDSAAAIALVEAGRLPVDGVPVFGTNATLVTDTTAQELLPAAGTGKTYWLTEVNIVNRTPAEAAIIQIQDDDGTPNEVFEALVATAAANGGSLHHKFTPPRKMPVTNKAVDGQATAALGDTKIHISAILGTDF